jgi:hypothetical protein
MYKKIKYFNYVYFSGRININFIPEKSIIVSPFKALAKSFIFIFYVLSGIFRNRNMFSAKGKIVFFVMSSNNFVAINPVYLKLRNGTASLFGDKMYDKQIALFMPTVLSAGLAILFFPRLVYDYLNADATDKKRFRQGINDVILSYPFYYVSFLWFKLVKPKAIVISNDHVYSTRVLVHWANKFEIPSFYIQHASVTENFPPLEMTYAFLEGEDAKEKYIRAGSDPTKIELIGIPKLDKMFHRINYSKTIRTIGIASNSLEPLNTILDLIFFLNRHYPNIGLIYRPHRLQYTENKFKEDMYHILKNIPSNVKVSNPYEEPATDYLCKIDCLIAGESGIHLEAVLLNITSVYFFHETEYFDDYGFVKNNLIDLARDLSELKSIIDRSKDSRQNVRHRAKRYCYTIDSEYDGRSAELAVTLLLQKINNKQSIL